MLCLTGKCIATDEAVLDVLCLTGMCIPIDDVLLNVLCLAGMCLAIDEAVLDVLCLSSMCISIDETVLVVSWPGTPLSCLTQCCGVSGNVQPSLCHLRLQERGEEMWLALCSFISAFEELAFTNLRNCTNTFTAPIVIEQYPIERFSSVVCFSLSNVWSSVACEIGV